MNLDAVEKRSFSLPLRCNYLLWTPEPRPADPTLVILLHGHAMTPEQMLKLCAPLVGDGCLIASLQGPYQLWVNQEGNQRAEVAFHWATRFEAEHSHRLHHEMILQVLRECGVPGPRAVLLGFSQTVSLNYRFICTHTAAVHGAIGICGGIPGDWDSGLYQRTPAAALHISTREDQYYPPAVTGPYPERLHRYISDVEFHLLDGGHRIPTAAATIVQAWLHRLWT